MSEGGHPVPVITRNQPARFVSLDLERVGSHHVG